MCVVGRGERLFGRTREDKVGGFRSAEGALVGTGIPVDGPAEPQGGLPDFRSGPEIAEDGGVEFASDDHDGVIADARLSRGFPDHEGGENDEGIGGWGRRR